MLSIIVAGCTNGKTASAEVGQKLELAIKYLSEQKYEQAVLAYQEVIKIDSKNVTAYKGLSLAYVLQEKTGEAEQAIQDGLKAVPQNIQLQLALAGLMLDQDKADKAEAIYKEILSKENPPVSAYQAYTYYLSQSGKQADAIDLLEQAVGKNSIEYKLNSMLAELYFKNGNKEKALASINKSLTEEPNQSSSYILLAEIYKDKWEELITLADQYIQQNQSNTGQMLKMSALSGMGKYEDLIKLYEDLPTDFKDNPRTRFITAQAYSKLGKKDESIELLKPINITNLKDAGIIADLANIYLELGDKDNARKIAMQGIAADEAVIENYVVMYKSCESEDKKLAQVWAYKYVLASSLSYKGSLSKLADYELVPGSQTQSEEELTSKKIISRIVRDKTWADRVHPKSPQSNSLVYLDTKNNIAYQGYAQKSDNWKPFIKRYHSPTIYTKDNIPASALDNINRNYDGGWNKFLSDQGNPFNKIILVCGGGITGKINWPNPVIIEDNIPLEGHLQKAGYPIENITFVDM
ncbi:MAG: tetratricopeptide repeat protein [Syntrophomonadaceae bacterium]